MGTSGGDREVILNELLDKAPVQKSLLTWPGGVNAYLQRLLAARCPVLRFPAGGAPWRPLGSTYRWELSGALPRSGATNSTTLSFTSFFLKGQPGCPGVQGTVSRAPKWNMWPRDILIATQVRLVEVDTMAARRELVGDGPSWASGHHC